MKQFRDYPYNVTENGLVFRKGKSTPLKFDDSGKGYLRVTLSKNGTTCRFLVHRMVAEVYCDNPKKDPHVLHLDNNPKNNHYLNLKWGTHSENMSQCHHQGRCSNLIASEVAKNLQIAKTQKKLIKLMGSRFLGLEYKNSRPHVKYICLKCNGNFLHRTDSPSIKRGGVCRSCFISKVEDIV